jgi:hypothetical protein
MHTALESKFLVFSQPFAKQFSYLHVVCCFFSLLVPNQIFEENNAKAIKKIVFK